MSETKDIKTKSELMDSFVQIAIARGFSDYDGEAERFINETVDMYSNLPQPQLTIPKSIADDKVVKYAVEHPNLARFVINDILEGLAIDEYPIDYENVIKWIKPLINVDRDKLNVILAYLAGKAIGVDLVKVVEG